MPTPSSCGPTLAPLLAMCGRSCSSSRRPWPPSSASGLAASKPLCAAPINSCNLLVGRRQPLGQLRQTLLHARSRWPGQRHFDGLLLQQPGRRLAGRRRRRAACPPPALLPARPAAMAVCNRAGAVGSACQQLRLRLRLVGLASSFAAALAQLDGRRRRRPGRVPSTPACGRRRCAPAPSAAALALLARRLLVLGEFDDLAFLVVELQRPDQFDAVLHFIRLCGGQQFVGQFAGPARRAASSSLAPRSWHAVADGLEQVGSAGRSRPGAAHGRRPRQPWPSSGSP